MLLERESSSCLVGRRQYRKGKKMYHVSWSNWYHVQEMERYVAPRGDRLRMC